MVTPRELVRRTVEFENRGRVPRQMWLLPWALNHFPDEIKAIQEKYPDDIIGAPNTCKTALQVKGDPFEIGTYVDEWGCVWENEQRGIVGQMKDPVIKTWDDMDKFRKPEELLTIDVEKVNDFCRSTDKFVLAGCCPRPFERVQFLRGSEEVFVDLALGTPEFFELLKTVHDFYMKKLEVWSKMNVDAIFFMDDWGSQNSLLISPATWRKVFKPLYKEYIDIAHSAGKKAFMHSDGYISEIIPDLIELGLDAVNSQIFCMGVEELGRKYKGKITFWGEIDRQHILPEGSVDDIRQAVKLVKDSLYENGGAIAQCECGAAIVPANIEAVFETWDSM